MEEIEHLRVKVAFLKQENATLRDQVLDYQIAVGELKLANESTPEGENRGNS